MASKTLSTLSNRAENRRINKTGAQFRGLPDRAIVTIVLSLCGFGLMAIFSASAPDSWQSYQDTFLYLRRQAIACVFGLIGMFILSRQDYRQLKKWAWPLAIVSCFY